MHLTLRAELFTVCQLPAGAPVPAWVAGDPGFMSLTRTEEELSVVCPASVVPPETKQETGWRMFQLAGPIDFALTGVLASILDPLARAGIGIFALSTFNTDFVLVKGGQVAAAIQALRAAGHTVQPT